MWLIQPAASDPCDGVDAPVAAVWTAERRAAVPPEVATALDGRVARWSAARVATCRAAHAGELAPELATARGRGLDPSRADVRAAIDVLAGPRDPQLAARAMDLAASGVDPADCSRTTLVVAPDRALDADLAALTAALEAGRYTQVIAQRAALEPRVAAARDPVAAYRLWWDVGSAYRNLHDLAASKPAIRAAAEAATAAGETTGAVRGWADLATTSAMLGELTGVDDLLAMARGAAAHGDTRDDAQIVELAAGKVALERGAFTDALAGCERVAKSATPGSSLAADGRACVFDALMALARFPEAIAVARDNLADADAKLGPSHPHTLARVQSLATAYQAGGDAASAAPLWDRALAGDTALFGADSLPVMELLRSRAIAETPGGDASTPAALAAIERAVAIGEARLAPSDPKRAALLESYVFVLGAQPHVDRDALARVYDRAVAAYEKLDDPAGLARVLYNEADWWREDNRCDRMMPLLRRIVKIAEGSGRKLQTGAAALGAIGFCLGKDKQWAEAETALVDAIAQHDDAGDVLFGAQDRFEYAQQLALRGRRDQGVAVAKRALADLAGKPPPADQLRKPIEEWLRK